MKILRGPVIKRKSVTARDMEQGVLYEHAAAGVQSPAIYIRFGDTVYLVDSEESRTRLMRWRSSPVTCSNIETMRFRPVVELAYTVEE